MQTSEVTCIRYALRRLLKLYGDTEAARFGPLALKVVRMEFVRDGLSRSTVNNNMARIKRMFRWENEEELVPITVYQAIEAVPILPKRRSPAKEPAPIRPGNLTVYVAGRLLQRTRFHQVQAVVLSAEAYCDHPQPAPESLINSSDEDQSADDGVDIPYCSETSHCRCITMGKLNPNPAA